MKFLHAADLHLDAPFRGVGAVDEERPHIAQTLREAGFRAWDATVDLALHEQVDFVVVAGDVFDGAVRGLRGQLAFAKGLERLGDSGVRSFICHGNHDPLSGWSPAVKLHPLAKVFGSDLEEVLLEDLGVRVAGKSYGERADTENPAPTYTLEPRPGLFSVGVLHATAGGSAGHSPYAPCSVAELAATGLDYVALGHIHTHAILHRDPWIVYPGCLQGRHINEAGPKGCCIVEVGSSGTGVRFEALDTVRWQRLAVEAANLNDQRALREALVSAVEESLETAEGRSLCLRLRIEGRTPLDGELRTRGTLDEHLAALRTEFADAEPFAWVERIDVSTRPPADLEARARQTDLLGLALQAAREAMDAEELPDGAVEALTPMFEKLQDAGAEPLAEDELRAALGDARLLCLDLLDRERPG